MTDLERLRLLQHRKKILSERDTDNRGIITKLNRKINKLLALTTGDANV